MLRASLVFTSEYVHAKVLYIVSPNILAWNYLLNKACVVIHFIYEVLNVMMKKEKRHVNFFIEVGLFRSVILFCFVMVVMNLACLYKYFFLVRRTEEGSMKRQWF